MKSNYEKWREEAIVDMWFYFKPTYWLDESHSISLKMPRWVAEIYHSYAVMD